ncbi:nucleotidyltransferase family protein [Mesorhizobium sp. M1338]|uniref:nucleotidyltransferase family protein n=1 Tax=unclassified Mesorhizobium TaxID=325217 RepID=UPI00333ACC80
MHQLPQDMGEYLRFVHDCNRERNLRLRAQLLEAVAALNRHDIVPLRLKGAAPLFLSPARRVPSRMTSDLDLAVGRGGCPSLS